LLPKRQQKSNRPGRTIVVHKGRAVCSAVDEIISGRPAAMIRPVDRLNTAHMFLTTSGPLDCATSKIDKIRKPNILRPKIRKAWAPHKPRKIGSSAQMRKILLAA
jgi:hypothetical protein